jgi:hypothetical protein
LLADHLYAAAIEALKSHFSMFRQPILLHDLQPSLQLLLAIQSHSLDFFSLTLTSEGLASWHRNMNWAPRKWQLCGLKGEGAVNEEAECPRCSNKLIHLWRDAGHEQEQAQCRAPVC